MASSKPAERQEPDSQSSGRSTEELGNFDHQQQQPLAQQQFTNPSVLMLDNGQIIFVCNASTAESNHQTSAQSTLQNNVLTAQSQETHQSQQVTNRLTTQ